MPPSPSTPSTLLLSLVLPLLAIVLVLSFPAVVVVVLPLLAVVAVLVLVLSLLAVVLVLPLLVLPLLVVVVLVLVVLPEVSWLGSTCTILLLPVWRFWHFLLPPLVASSVAFFLWLFCPVPLSPFS